MELINLLKAYDQEYVAVYESYVYKLKTDVTKDGVLVNWWAKNISDKEYSDIYRKVFIKTGMSIDGESITIVYRKKMIATFDYHAYKNKVTITYPESIFDFGVVYNTDKFEFRKENGKVYYTHKLNDPFATTKAIVGAYGIIKNNKGEFIELLNMKDIQKMKNTSKMKDIWDTWFDRMVLKSVIKRICSTHFHDIVKDMDVMDNNTNDPNRSTISELIQNDIDNAQTEEELGMIYKASIDNVDDKKAFIELCSKRKKEITDDLLS